MRPADTSPEAWARFIEIQRSTPPEVRLQRALELSELAFAFAEAGMRERHPRASDREIFLRLAKMRLGSDLFRRVYGDALAEDEPPRPKS